MVTSTFDTLKFVERLRAAGVPESQAKAEAEALADVLGMVDVATQRDLKELETRVREQCCFRTLWLCQRAYTGSTSVV
jgi:hypothetical protein